MVHKFYPLSSVVQVQMKGAAQLHSSKCGIGTNTLSISSTPPLLPLLQLHASFSKGQNFNGSGHLEKAIVVVEAIAVVDEAVAAVHAETTRCLFSSIY